MLEQTGHAEEINKKREIRNNGVILIWRCKQYSPNRQIKMTAKYSGYTVCLLASQSLFLQVSKSCSFFGMSARQTTVLMEMAQQSSA